MENIFKIKTRQDENMEHKVNSLFVMFCIWTFVILCRPQDIFPLLSPLRPALSTGVVTLILFFIHHENLKRPELLNEQQVRHYSALIFVMILGIPFSFYPGLSFKFIFTDYIKVIIFFYVFYKVVDSVKRIITVLLFGCLGNGLYSAFSVASGSLYSGRLSFGDMFDPNDLAYFSLGFLPLNLLFLSRDNPSWARLACIGSFGSGLLLILLTGSRSGVLALAVSSAMLLFLRTKTVRAPLKAVFLVMCIVFLSFGSINTERYLTIFSLEEDYNVTSETGRVGIWKIGARAMLANPLTGVGVQCFNLAVGLDRQAREAETIRWQTAHNSLIQIGTETGIIGLSLTLLMSLNVFRIFNKARKGSCSDRLVKIGEMGLVGFAGLFVSSLFLSQAYSFYWAFYVVLSAVVNQLLARGNAMLPRQT